MKPYDDPSIHLARDAQGRLVLNEGEEAPCEVQPVRMFPITDPDRWIALCDAEGREVVTIADTAALSADVRRLLADELTRRQFLPVVERINRVTVLPGHLRWEVETDRGPTGFTTSGENEIRRVGAQSAVILDTHGVRYLIQDTAALDMASQRILDRYL